MFANTSDQLAKTGFKFNQPGMKDWRASTISTAESSLISIVARNEMKKRIKIQGSANTSEAHNITPGDFHLTLYKCGFMNQITDVYSSLSLFLALHEQNARQFPKSKSKFQNWLSSSFENVAVSIHRGYNPKNHKTSQNYY